MANRCRVGHHTLTLSKRTETINSIIDEVKAKADESNSQITVMMPQFIAKKWWHSFLHNQSEFLIMANLLRIEKIIITIIPYQLEK